MSPSPFPFLACLFLTAHALPSPLSGLPPLLPPRSSGPVPPYVLQYAPLIHLSEDELYWPSKISTHLEHTILRFSPNGSTVPDLPPPGRLTPDTVGFLGNRSELFLEAGVMDEAFKRGEADWLGSTYGIPDERGRSESEVIIILVDKSEIIGPGYLDAFYFTFYSSVLSFPLSHIAPGPTTDGTICGYSETRYNE